LDDATATIVLAVTVRTSSSSLFVPRTAASLPMSTTQAGPPLEP
jgi:hypothetical protein